MDRFIIFTTHHPILIGIFIVLLVLLIVTELQKNGKAINNSELTYLINEKEAIVLDIRDKKSFDNGHITHAINIPQTKLKDRLSELNKQKDSPIVLVCAQGQHSGSYVQVLTKAGFTQLHRLRGGIIGWTGDNLPLVKK